MYPSPRRKWGFAIGISIFLACPGVAALAAQEPVMRILINDSKKFRFRADGSIPLLVRGIGYREKRLSTLNLKLENGQIQWAMGPEQNRWISLPSNRKISIRSTDPRGIWLGKRRYRGEVRIGVQEKRLIAVNHLGVERYLMSVVGSEMPKDWPKAALQAQAVAARTYALKRLGKTDSFDINSTESSQVYLGIESETKSTINAVNSTRSLVLRHKGKLISAVFHSISGGRTEASGSVWKYQLPYLISVPDYDQHSPKYQWIMSFNPHDLRKIFFEIGGLNNLRILKTSQTGRIIQAKAYGPKGEILFTGNQIRQRLKLKSTHAKFEVLAEKTKSEKNTSKFLTNSKNFKSLPLLPPIPKGYFLLVRGFGAGHGVGMSQWGAHGMAKKGANFRQILHHFYSGIKILPY